MHRGLAPRAVKPRLFPPPRSYYTMRTVKIRDRKLGLLAYSLLVGIFAYIAYDVVVDQAYKVSACQPRTHVRKHSPLLPHALAPAER